MSFNNNTGIISKPVTVPDVQRALGAGSTSVYALCRHDSINKYSRYKPYAFGGILPDGLYKQRVLGQNNDDIITANNFGMAPGVIKWPASGSLSNPDGASDTTGCVTPWGVWMAPSGLKAASSPSGADEPCRIGDFNEYDTKATAHIAKLEIIGDGNGGILQLVLGGSVGARLTFNPLGTSIALSEFKYGNMKLSDMYLTIIVANYKPRSTTQSGATVVAQWGEKMLIAQSTQKLGDVVGIASSPASQKIEATLKLAAADSEAITTEFLYSNNEYYIAVGLAQKFENGAMTVKTLSGGCKMVTCNGTMPITLVSFDMWNSLPKSMFSALRTVGVVQPSQVETFVTIGRIATTPKLTATKTTKDGKEGVLLSLAGSSLGLIVSGVGNYDDFDNFIEDDAYLNRGRFMIEVMGYVDYSDRDTDYSEPLEFYSPVGMKGYQFNFLANDKINAIADSQSTEITGVENTFKGSMFIPFPEGKNAEMAKVAHLDIYVHGSYSEENHIRYIPRLESQYGSWSNETIQATIQ